jgi:lipopolysaccharide export system permease protein
VVNDERVGTVLIERYILKQLARPFLLGVFVVTFLLSMDFLLDYLDLFLGKGIDLISVLKLFFLGLGWMLALSVPCGVLVGVLMTYGRLAQDSEIVAMRASGISPLRAVRPTFIAGLGLFVAMVFFHNDVLPDMNHAFANLMLAINKKRPTAEIQEGVFIDNFPGYNLFIGHLDDRTGKMRDILIYDSSRKEESARTIRARRGRLEFDPGTGILSLHLEDGEIHEAARDRGPVYRKMDFQRQTLNIHGIREALEQSGRRSRGQREMDIAAMQVKVGELQEERGRYDERCRAALEELGLSQVEDLPGVETARPWYAGLAALVGRRPPASQALPDSFWTPPRRRLAEEAKLTHMQAEAASKKINQYWVEIHKKYSIPFACVVFTLIGAPLGIRARRGGLAAGFISVGFFIFYYLCLVGGEQLADRRYADPWISMWLPNIVLGLLGLWLTARVCQYRPPWRRRTRAGSARA